MIGSALGECGTAASATQCSCTGRPAPSQGCLHCIACCTSLTYRKAALIRSCNATDEWREWWPAGIQSPSVYYYLRAKQLRYLQQQPARDADSLWRPCSDCCYGASPTLRRRHRAALAIHVPLAVTGIDGSDDVSVSFLGTKLIRLLPPPPPPPSARLLRSQQLQALPYCQPSPGLPASAPLSMHTPLLLAHYQHQQQQMAAAGALHAASPAQHHYLQQQQQQQQQARQAGHLAAALAAAKQLAGHSMAAAQPPYGGHPLHASPFSGQGHAGGGHHPTPRWVDVPLLSPSGSSSELSVASSGGSGASLHHLAPLPVSPCSLDSSPGETQQQQQHVQQHAAQQQQQQMLSSHHILPLQAGRPPLPPAPPLLDARLGAKRPGIVVCAAAVQHKDCCQWRAMAPWGASQHHARALALQQPRRHVPAMS